MPKKPRDLSRLDWDDVRLFLAVTDAGSIRAAAERLDLHHSTLARRLTKLETTLREPLLQATSAGHCACNLTPKGRTLVALAQGMLDAARRITELRA